MMGPILCVPQKNAHEYLVQFYCPVGEYSLLASLFLSPSEVSIRLCCSCEGNG